MHDLGRNDFARTGSGKRLFREELGLPPLSRTREAFRAHLVGTLAGAQYPIRNEEELRRAFGACVWSDRLIELVAPQDYLFTNAQQVATRIADRAAALWDLAARAGERETAERARRREIHRRISRYRVDGRRAQADRSDPGPALH